jgi:hypothetical protein
VANTIEIHTHTCEAFFFNDKYIIIKKQVHAQDEQRPLKQLWGSEFESEFRAKIFGL